MANKRRDKSFSIIATEFLSQISNWNIKSNLSLIQIEIKRFAKTKCALKKHELTNKTDDRTIINCTPCFSWRHNTFIFFYQFVVTRSICFNTMSKSFILQTDFSGLSGFISFRIHIHSFFSHPPFFSQICLTFDHQCFFRKHWLYVW